MQERAGTTRRSLLEAAARLFHERGYAGTSISDISELSGHTSGAIYFHFSNKEELARRVVEAHFATWPVLISRYTGTGGSALEEFVCLSFAVARAFRDDVIVRGGARLWAERTTIAATLPLPFVGWIDAAGELLARARADGELASHIEPATAARTIVVAFFGLHTVSDALDGRIGIEDDLTSLWGLLLPSLQSRPDAAGVLRRARQLLGDRTDALARGDFPAGAPRSGAVPIPSP